MKKRYHVNADTWLYGKLYRKGSFIELTPKQAKYELLAGTIAVERTPVSVGVPGLKETVEVVVPPVVSRVVTMRKIDKVDVTAKAAVALEPAASVPDKSEHFVVPTKLGKSDIVVAFDGKDKKGFDRDGLDMGSIVTEAIKMANPILPAFVKKEVKKPKKDDDK